MTKSSKKKGKKGGGKYREDGSIEDVPNRLTHRRRKVIKMKKRICEKYPDRYEMWMCLAKKRNWKKGPKRCRRRATDKGLRCKFHGGKSTGPKRKTGKYSIHGKKFLDTYEKFLSDPNAINLVDELAILRTCVSKMIEYLKDGYSRNDKVELMEKITSTVDTIGKMAERLRKIHVSYFSMESVYLVVRQMVNLIETAITVCPHCNKSISGVKESLCRSIMDMNIPGATRSNITIDGKVKMLEG